MIGAFAYLIGAIGWFAVASATDCAWQHKALGTIAWPMAVTMHVAARAYGQPIKHTCSLPAPPNLPEGEK